MPGYVPHGAKICPPCDVRLWDGSSRNRTPQKNQERRVPRLLLHCLVRSNEERLPNGRERRGIAEVQVQEVGHTHARMQGSGCDVNSLGHALFAGHLAAQKTLARAVPEKPEKQRPAVEVPGMRSGMEEDGIGLKPCGTRLRCAQTGARDLELE